MAFKAHFVSVLSNSLSFSILCDTSANLYRLFMYLFDCPSPTVSKELTFKISS